MTSYQLADGERTQLYQTLLDSQAALICCLTPDGTIAFANAAVRQYFAIGMSSDNDTAAVNFFARIPAEDRASISRPWQKLTPQRPKMVCEHRAIAADAQSHGYRWHYTAHFDARGQLQHYQLSGLALDASSEPAPQSPVSDRLDWQLLFAHLPLGLAIADPQGRLIETNAAFDELRAVLGEGDSIAALAAVWSPCDRRGQPLTESAFAPLRALRERCTVANAEVCCRHRETQTEIWLSITAIPILSVGFGAVIACRHVTRQHSDPALERQQATLQAVIDALPDLVLHLDRNGTILHCSIPPHFQTALPPAPALIGCSASNLLPTAAAALSAERIQAAQATGQTQVWQYDLPIGGRTARYEARAIACGRNEVLNLVRDISDRQAAEAALRDSEQRFRAIFAQAAVGMALLTLDGNFFRVNQCFCEIAGYTPIELLTKTDEELTVPSDRAADREQRARLLAGGALSSYALEKRYQRRDGRHIWTYVNVSLVRQHVQDAQYFLAVIQDISDRKAVEQQLQRQAKRERLVTAIAQRIHESLHLDDILRTAVLEVRHFLTCDRVSIGRLDGNADAALAAESVQPPWRPLLNDTLDAARAQPAACLKASLDCVVEVADADQATSQLSSHCQAFLTQFPARAHLIVPIVLNRDWERSRSTAGRPAAENQLWGWLAAQHCSHPRQWQVEEIDFLKRVTTQLSIAIRQSQLYEELAAANQELRRLVTTDSLTQIANRRCFDRYLQHEWERAQRDRQPLALILTDIDDFKRYNDTYGHPEGDRCLQQVAAILQAAAGRSSDLAARYGGEEFALVLPNTDLAGAIQVANSIQAAIATAAIPHASSRVGDWLTLSLGIACQVPTAGDAAELVSQADQALYRAKAAGRDRFCY